MIPSRAVRSPLCLAILAAGCAHRAPAPQPAPPPHAPPAASAPDASAPRRALRHREPEAAPAEFAARTREVDVDRDGRPDRALLYPALPPIGEWRVTFADVPPAVIAHRLADGRYALDDEVTRASLRALCPAALAPVSPHASTESAPAGSERGPHAQMLFLEGLCRRVWGASADEAVAAARASARGASPGLFDAATVDAVADALRAYPVPLELDAHPAEPLALVTAAPPAAAAPTPAPDPRCAPVRRANDLLRQRANRAALPTLNDMPVTLGQGELPECMATERGVWSVQLRGHDVTRTADSVTLEARAELVWRPAAGPAPTPLRPPFELSATAFTQEWASLAATSDYDGDGTPEVVVRRSAWEHEGGGSERLAVYTTRDGRVQPYAPAAAFGEAREAVDADRDGRADLVLPSPWTVTDVCGLEGIEHPGPTVLAHALPDGTFSTTDAVARAWALAGCHRGGNDEPDVVDVACARIRGVGPEDTVAALQARWPAGPQCLTPETQQGLCLTFPSLAATALVNPPFAPVREGDVPALP